MCVCGCVFFVCEDYRGKFNESFLTLSGRRSIYKNVSRSLGLAKAILQGTVKGERRQGRHKRRWEDNIRESTGLDLAKFQKAMKNKDKRRKLVVKSIVAPMTPAVKA